MNTDTEEYTGPWTAAMVKCLACGYEQVSRLAEEEGP
jgi:hypothetical protein